MPSRSRVLQALAAALLLQAPEAAGQIPDPVFAGYRFAPDVASARPAGVGGAFTAISDGGKSAYANPAGLVLIPSRELEFSTNRRWGTLAATAFRYLHLAAYAAETGSQELGSDAPGQLLDSTVWEAGLGVGFEPIRRAKFGATVAFSHLSLDALRPAGSAGPATAVSADDTHARLTVGMLLTVLGAETRSLPTVRLGVSVQPGFDWTARVAGGSGVSSAAVRRPSLVTAGLAWRTTDRWSFSAQGDVIRYSEVVDALHRNAGARADGYRLPNVIEPRLGAEFAAPLWCGCGVAKARAGLHYMSPGTLAYQGSDPVAAAAFASGKWRTAASAGVSFLAEHFGNALRFDLDAADVFDGPEISFGIAWRF